MHRDPQLHMDIDMQHSFRTERRDRATDGAPARAELERDRYV